MSRKPKVIVTNKAFPQTIALLREHFEVIVNDSESPLPAGKLATLCSDADGIMAFMPDRIDDAFLASCPRLRIVACALKGFDNFDVPACTRRGIWVSIVPDLLTEPTAELAIGLAIGIGRHVPAADRVIRSGAFAGWRPKFYGTSLDGSTVAIIGAGRVGCAIARKLSGFSATVLMHDIKAQHALPQNARPTSIEDALKNADFVILAVPLSAGTHHMVDREWLSQLKPGALLINPARGSVVNEAAVAEALASGQLGGYAADVFECEEWARSDRPANVHPGLLLQTECTLFTTHIGSAVTTVRMAIEHDAAANLIEALSGKTPHGAINLPVDAAAKSTVTA